MMPGNWTNRRQIYLSVPLHLKLRQIAWQHGLKIRELVEHVLGDEALVRACAQKHARARDGDHDLADK